MAPASNWLSFSLSPMEMWRSSSSSDSQFLPYDASQSAASPHYFLDNFYANGNLSLSLLLSLSFFKCMVIFLFSFFFLHLREFKWKVSCFKLAYKSTVFKNSTFMKKYSNLLNILFACWEKVRTENWCQRFYLFMLFLC